MRFMILWISGVTVLCDSIFYWDKLGILTKITISLYVQYKVIFLTIFVVI